MSFIDLYKLEATHLLLQQPVAAGGMTDRISSGLAYFKRRFSSTENIENETEMEAPSLGTSEVKRTTSGLSNTSSTVASGEDH